METNEKSAELLQEVAVQEHELILINDEVNTFEHVIDCLVSICGHNEYQAEQCAWITHTKGKCSVKLGSLEKLEPMFIALQMQNLSVELN